MECISTPTFGRVNSELVRPELVYVNEADSITSAFDPPCQKRASGDKVFKCV